MTKPKFTEAHLIGEFAGSGLIVSREVTSIQVDDRETGRTVRAEREKIGWRLREAATKSGTSLSYICDLENGRRSWTAPQALKYLAVIKRHRVHEIPHADDDAGMPGKGEL